MLSAPHANNKTVSFQGRVTRERAVADKAKGLSKRGLISKKQMRRLRHKEDR